MNRTGRFGYFVAGFSVLAVVLAGLVTLSYFLDGFSRETKIVEIQRGIGLFSIAKKLEQHEVIRKAEILILPTLVSGSRGEFKYGEYMFSPGETPYSIHKKLRSGEVFLRKATFPEGLTLKKMAAILESSHIVSRQEFLSLAENSEYSTKKLGEDVLSLEGFLFPDTYFFPRGSSAEKVIETMLRRFWEVCAPLGIKRGEIGVREIVTTASLIEKETASSDEKPLVSAVIRNRLRRGMKLEFDPTVIYALGERFDGDIRKKDLSFSSPYNTYVVSGLPPGPIAAPGVDSIQAALEPADVNYLYFVATGDGRHIFSSTYRAHQKAVNRMLRSKRR